MSALPRFRAFALAVTLLFAAVLWLPLLSAPGQVAQYFIAPPEPNHPSWRPRSLAAIDRRFLTDFPYRLELRALYDQVRRIGFGILPASVVPGDDGWLFYRADAVGDGDTFSDFAGGAQPDRATLDRWTQILAARRAEAAARGAVYLAVAVPNKETIYADRLPAAIRAAAGPTRLAALTGRLGESHPGWLDLRPVLRRARLDQPVFRRLDTHWTAAGALAATEAILARLRQDNARLSALLLVSPAPLDSLRPRSHRFRGDIGVMAAHWDEETFELLWPDHDLPARCDAAHGGRPALGPQGPGCQPDYHGDLITEQPDAAELPTATIFHDSFAEALMPFLAQYFRRIHWVWGSYSSAIAAADRADIVIQERTERLLPTLFDGQPADDRPIRPATPVPTSASLP